MKCNFCEEKVSDRANFCPNCKNQIKCLSCSEVLEKDSDICIICGEEKKSQEKNHNTIEFQETKKTRSFKASFSNEVGNSIGEALGIILMNKRGISLNEKKILDALPQDKSGQSDSDTIEDTDYTEVPNTSNKKDKVFDIFNESGGNLTLLETRLKATSKRDYGIRLAIIFLYYKLLKGIAKVDRNDLNSIMKDASLYDGNFRYWLTNTNLVGVHEDVIELKAPGRDKAKEFVAEVYDDSKIDKWKLGSPARKRKKKDSEEEVNE